MELKICEAVAAQVLFIYLFIYFLSSLYSPDTTEIYLKDYFSKMTLTIN